MQTDTVEETSAKEKILQWAQKHGVTMTAEFIPWSQSRNKGEKSPSLNWIVTIHKTYGGIHAGMSGSNERLDIAPETRAVLKTDYMAGCAHCPSYGPQYGADSYAKNHETRERVARECETGRKHGKYLHNIGYTTKGAPILPDLDSVLWSLSMDYGILDEGGFESWAQSFGYDTDSRKAEATYRACLDMAVALRHAFGDEAMRELCEAGQDY